MIFSFDLDGTLVSYYDDIHPETIKAIQAARTKGHTTVISTGRPVDGIKPINKKCPVDYWIASNGATIVDAKTNKIISDNVIDKETAVEAINFFRTRVQSFLMQGKHKMQFNYEQIKRDYGYSYYDKVNWPVNSDIDSIPKDAFVGIRQFAAFGAKKHWREIISEVRENPKLKALNPIAIKLESGDYWFDIPFNRMDKSTALEKLQRILKKQNEELYHFGDSYNDLSAMKLFNGIAMVNAPYELKENSIKIVDEEDGGIGKFIYSHI